MLEIRTDNGKTDISFSGTITDILADLTCAIRSIYSSLKEEDEDIANCFMFTCKEHIMDVVFKDGFMNEGKCVDKHKCNKCKCDKQDDDDDECENKVEKMNRLFEEMMRTALGK